MALMPSVDLMDRGPRLKRVVLSVLAGLGAGSLAYFIVTRIVQPTASSPSDRHVQVGRNMGATGFVTWATIVSAVVVFVLAIAIQTYLAKKKYRQTRDLPEAKLT